MPVAAHPVAGTDPAYALFTSGTTGEPKLCFHGHRDAVIYQNAFGAPVLGLRPGDLTLSVSKTYFAYGLGNSVFYPLLSGATAVLVPEVPSTGLVSDRIIRHAIRALFAVPSFYARMLSDQAADALATVGMAVCAGEVIPSMIVTGAGMGVSNVVRSATAIGVAEPARAGMTSGINETFQQVGVAVGIAALGSFFESRVVAAFAPAAAGSLGAATTAVGKAIAAGDIGAATGHVPARTAVTIAQASRHAFLAGLHDVLLTAAAIALAGSVAGFLLIRSRDLHVTALSPVPPELDPEHVGLDDPSQGDEPANVS